MSKAALTGIWTARAKDYFSVFDKNIETVLPKAISIGTIAAKMQMERSEKGLRTQVNDILHQAKQLHQSMEEKSKTLAQNPPEFMKDLPKEAQTAVIKEFIRFRHVMGDVMPLKIGQEVVHTVQMHAKHDTPTQAIHGMIHLCRQGYTKELQTLSTDKAISHSMKLQTHKTEQLSKALTQSQNLALQNERNLLLQRQLNRGFER